MYTQDEIHLARFEVGGSEVWMPGSGVGKSYWKWLDNPRDKSTLSSTPVILTTLKILQGTMEFNTSLAADTFTIKYKPGTPISDQLSKVAYEYGQQKLPPQPSQSEVEAMLKEQVSQAQAQKKVLVAYTPSADWAWSRSLALFFAGLLVVSLVVIWGQRRGG
jgi:hypothetical protein